MEIKENVIDKIQKLLALAGDKSSESESQAAMLKAQHLMAKHNLTAADISGREKSDDKVIIQSMRQLKRLPWWQKTLAATIAKNFKCRCLTTRNRMKQLSYMQFVGHPEDIEICASVYGFAQNQIDYLAHQYMDNWKRKYGYSDLAIKNNYILGYLRGIEAKFKEQVDKNNWGLIVVCDKSVNEACEKAITSHVKSHVNAQFSGNQQAISDGYEDGKRFSPTNGTIEKE